MLARGSGWLVEYPRTWKPEQYPNVETSRAAAIFSAAGRCPGTPERGNQSAPRTWKPTRQPMPGLFLQCALNRTFQEPNPSHLRRSFPGRAHAARQRSKRLPRQYSPAIRRAPGGHRLPGPGPGTSPTIVERLLLSCAESTQPRTWKPVAPPNVETSTDILTLPTVQAAPERGNDRENREFIIINKLRLTRLTVDAMIRPDKRGSNAVLPRTWKR